MAQPIPEGFHTLTPHIIVKDVAEAMVWYAKAFGAEEALRLPAPDGNIIHAEIKIGNSQIMLAPANEQWGNKDPNMLGGTAVTLHIYAEDVDALYKQATDAGAKGTMPPEDMFWGDRYAKVVDPWGHQWGLATHIADPTPEEMNKAMQEMFSQQKG